MTCHFNPRRTAIRAADPQLAERPALTTVANVEILSTGTYHLASGLTTFTVDDLLDAVAAQDDPGVLPPRIKIGHDDPRFDGTGEPALGKVLNMRLSENEQTIIGDFVGVPVWLADIMPSAYPSRSVEGDFDVEVAFEGRIGGETVRRKYRLVLSAVALLGTKMPGVETLDDLPGMFDGTTFAEVAGEKAAGGVQGGATFEAMRVKAAQRQVTASINVEDVRRAYYTAIEGDPDAWSYWIRAIYIDPNELIVDIGEGDANLLRIPFDVNASGDVEFGDASPVKVEYVAAGGAVAAAQGRQFAIYANRDDARPDNESEGTEMDQETLTQLRSAFGLAEDASEADVKAELAERAKAESGEGDGETPPETPPEPAPAEGEPPAEGAPAQPPEGEPSPAEGEGEPSAETTPEPVAAGEGTLVDPAALAELQRDAKAGRAARTEQLTEARERWLTDAVKAGKFPPASKDHYRKLHQKDPKGTEQFVASLADGVVPVNKDEVGESGSVSAEASAYPAGWFPELRREGAEGGDRPFVTKD